MSENKEIFFNSVEAREIGYFLAYSRLCGFRTCRRSRALPSKQELAYPTQALRRSRATWPLGRLLTCETFWRESVHLRHRLWIATRRQVILNLAIGPCIKEHLFENSSPSLLFFLISYFDEHFDIFVVHFQQIIHMASCSFICFVIYLFNDLLTATDLQFRYTVKQN